MGRIKDIRNPYGVFKVDLTYIYSNFRMVRSQKKDRLWDIIMRVYI